MPILEALAVTQLSEGQQVQGEVERSELRDP